MLHPKNECIAARAFAALLLDYEYPGDAYCPPYASGRILVEDLCREHVSAGNRAELIEYFKAWRDNR